MMTSENYLEIDGNLLPYQGATSKGNQEKFVYNNNWYKVDTLGYEGLSEVLCSRLAKSIKYPYSVLEYEPAVIYNYPYADKNGCLSRNFIENGIKEISILRLLNLYDADLIKKINRNIATSDKIKLVVNAVKLVTGLNNFGEYLTSILEFDRLVLNEDRHLHNILLLYDKNNSRYTYAPLFDNGAALLSDTYRDYPLDLSLSEAVNKVKAKPFNSNFDKQVKACQELYGIQIKPSKEIQVVIEDLVDLYTAKEIERVCKLLENRIRYYYKDCSISFIKQYSKDTTDFFS